MLFFQLFFRKKKGDKVRMKEEQIKGSYYYRLLKALCLFLFSLYRKTG